MKKLNSFFLICILFIGCVATEKQDVKTTVGLFTPYSLFPESLHGKIKKIVEKNYLTKEVDGKTVADRQLTSADRESMDWTNDFIATFNEDGTVIQCDLIDENNKVIYSTKNSFEGKNVVKSANYKNDTLQDYQLINYDSENRIVKIEGYSATDTLQNSFTITNDQNGNMIAALFSNMKNDKKGNYEFSYNEDNKRVGYTYKNNEGIKTFEQKFYYNQSGFMEKQVLIDKENKESEFDYSYVLSENGNWVECIGSDGKSKFLARREIEYFE